MTIISTTHLSRELPSDATDTDNQITDAVTQASAFVDTWTSKHFFPFEDYTASPLATNAPDVIVRKCIEIAKAIYYQRIAWTNGRGDEGVYWDQRLKEYRNDLEKITIAPTWTEETISLSAINTMGLGNRTNGGGWTQVIPSTAQVVDSGSDVWIYPDDWEISMGGRYSDEYTDRWYLYSNTSSLSGTIRYMKTYRNDGLDYARYSRL